MLNTTLTLMGFHPADVAPPNIINSEQEMHYHHSQRRDVVGETGTFLSLIIPCFVFHEIVQFQ